MKQLIKNSFLAIILLLTLQSCDDNETELVFNDVPAVRLEKQAKELQDLLKSSADGWKVTYFTDNTQLGGFSYLFKFTDNQTIEMASDFGGNDDVTSSQWAIQVGATLKLSFTTKNKIHELSDSNNFPDDDLEGQGYKGSFEFLYYGTEGDDIIFRTNRDFIELRLTKADANDWGNLKKNQDIIDFIDNSSKRLSYEIGTTVFNFDYNKNRRFAYNIDNNNEVNFGIGYSSTGIVISPAIEVNGIKHTTFELDKIKGELVSTTDGVFKIIIVDLPFNILQDWSIDTTNPLDFSSDFFDKYVEIYNANVTAYGEDLQRTIFFGSRTINGVNAPGIVFQSRSSPTQLWTTQQKLVFSLISSDSELDISKGDQGLNWSFYTHLDPLVDYIIDNAPYTITETSSTETKLTSTIDPNAWFILKQ